MRLGTVEHAGGARAAVQDGREWVLLDAADVGSLAASPDWRAQAARAVADPDSTRLTGPRLLRPILRPGKVICCGLNYRDHIAETGRETPQYPTLFAKFADTLTDPDADITIAGSQKVDWEAELAVVVGAEASRVDRAGATAAILGYTVANDVSARDWQSRTLQWLPGKAFDASCPMGPCVVTPDEFDPVAGAAIGTAIDGTTVQDSNTRHLLFDAADLLAYVSAFARLHPGDVILTGTPGGVGLGRSPQRFLADGETVTTWVEGIGQLHNRFHLVPEERA